MKVVLHIGSHKSGTKFLQHKVFKHIRKSSVCYNPDQLTQLLCDLCKSDCETEAQHVINLIKDNIVKLKSVDKYETILISREIMSGDLFRCYENSLEIHDRIHRSIPNAQILYAFRAHADWLISTFRESIHEHHYQSFMGYIGKEKHNNQFVKCDIGLLSYCSIADNLIRLFGDNNVKFLFYEDFKEDKTKFLKSIEKFAPSLGDLEYVDDGDHIPNRGYSSLAIFLTLTRYNILKFLGLHGLCHRPIFFFGPKSIPAGNENLSVLNREKYWGSQFFRDNEEIRSETYPVLSFRERIRYILSWRYFAKEILDKIIYINFPIVNRNEIKSIRNRFRQDSIELEKIIKERLPEQYYQ
ncbi:MAG: hypothetical protein HOI70_07720 [Opitutae bacterium]|nr:hypothetical protein [Opitutae bacterium]